MKVGICCEAPGPWSTGDFLKRSAQAAERSGFSGFWFGEHVLLFGSYESKYPYAGVANWAENEGDDPIPDPRSPFPDPVMAMTWVAAATTTLEVGSSILILPQRNPVVLANEIACLDEFSQGRVTLGVGVGWCREEGEAIGVDWKKRGKLADEYIDVMRKLWTQAPASHHGPTISFDDAYMFPQPVHGTVPIMVGGDTEIALRRVARAGDGWMCFSVAIEDMADRVAYLREETKKQGRDPDALRISKSIFTWTTEDEMARYREAGVTEFLLFKVAELSLEDAELNEQMAEAGAQFAATVADW